MHRLSGQDAWFLYQETPAALMHTLKIVVCRPPHEPPDPQRFRDLVVGSLAALPLFQYRVVPVPLGLHHPVVVDDGGFDFERHVHRVTVPAPGGQEQLDQVIGAIAAGQLDRARPLWEIWIVEGLAGGRVAYVNKMHHLLADGVAAVNYLAQVLYRDTTVPAATRAAASRREPQPSAATLVLDALRDLVRDFVRLPRLLAESIRARKAIAARNCTAAVVPPAPYSPEIPRLRFNRALSPERSYATAQFELEELRALGKRIGGTINDALLALTASALRRYLLRHDELPARALVCAVPVSADREASVARTWGNNVAYFHVRLRTDIADPSQRCRATLAETAAAKEVLELFGRDTAREWMQYIPP
jgi:diacylglycerol O-acyltransferase